MRMHRALAVSLFVFTLSASAQTTAPATQPVSTDQLAQRIEQAHGIDALRDQPAVQGDLVVEFGGNRMLDGVMTFTPNGGQVRIEDRKGPVMVFDGRKAWIAPADSEFKQARFHLLTWPYFALAPFKLRDPGANLTDPGPMKLNERDVPALKLTFGPGVGDTPDDWYILYPEPETDRLKAVAYIVTYGTPLSEAEKQPHAVVYDDFVNVEGVTFPQTWGFYNWSADPGPHGEPIGRASFNNIRFVTPEAQTFQKPEGAREDVLPEPGQSE